MELDARIPEPTREIFAQLQSQVVWIHGRWKIYRRFFTESHERIDLLNESAGTFFVLFDRMLVDNTILGLSRLCDPTGIENRKKTAFKQLLERLNVKIDEEDQSMVRLRNSIIGKERGESLVLEQLIAKLSEDDQSIVPALRAKLQVVRKHDRALRKVRNKRIAHSDLRHSLDPSAFSLPAISRERIERSLESVRSFMNTFEGHFAASETAYEFMDAREEELVWVMKSAVAYRDGERDGTIDREHLIKSRHYKS